MDRVSDREMQQSTSDPEDILWGASEGRKIREQKTKPVLREMREIRTRSRIGVLGESFGRQRVEFKNTG